MFSYDKKPLQKVFGFNHLNGSCYIIIATSCVLRSTWIGSVILKMRFLYPLSLSFFSLALDLSLSPRSRAHYRRGSLQQATASSVYKERIRGSVIDSMDIAPSTLHLDANIDVRREREERERERERERESMSS